METPAHSESTEQTTGQRRIRRSASEITRLLAEYESSGQTQIAFARERGLNLGTFRQWIYSRRHRAEGAERSVGGVVPLIVEGESRSGRGGLTVRIPG